MRRARQQTITFPAYDSTLGTGALKSGLTLLAADVQISKDGAAFAAATNAPTELGSTGVYALTLTAAETNCGHITILIRKAGMRPQIEGGFTDPHPAAAVVDDAANSSSTFKTNLTEAANDFHKGAGLKFESGANAGQVREITGYNSSTKFVTFTEPFAVEPTAGDTFTIINS